jgi:hypothetical protein
VADDEVPPTVGSLSGWIRDGALAGALMPGVVLGLMYAEQLARYGPGVDVRDLGAAMGFGCALGALLAPALQLYTRLALRLGSLPALGAGPVAGSVAGVVLTYALAWMFDGHPPPLVWRDFALIGATGAVALGPPWAAYVAVRLKQRATIGVVIGAVVWTTIPTAILRLAVEILYP